MVKCIPAIRSGYSLMPVAFVPSCVKGIAKICNTLHALLVAKETKSKECVRKCETFQCVSDSFVWYLLVQEDMYHILLKGLMYVETG